jgi:hypothetical protein
MGDDEADHGGEVFDRPEAAGLPFHGLVDAVEGLGRAFGHASPEVVHDAVPVVADGLGGLFHLRDPRTAHPPAPPLEVPLGDARVRFLHEVAQGIQLVEGLAGQELPGADPLPGPEFGAGQAVLPLEQRPAHPLELLRELAPLPAPDLVEGVAHQFHHVEVLEDQQSALSPPRSP